MRTIPLVKVYSDCLKGLLPTQNTSGWLRIRMRFIAFLFIESEYFSRARGPLGILPNCTKSDGKKLWFNEINNDPTAGTPLKSLGIVFAVAPCISQYRTILPRIVADENEAFATQSVSTTRMVKSFRGQRLHTLRAKKHARQVILCAITSEGTLQPES